MRLLENNTTTKPLTPTRNEKIIRTSVQTIRTPVHSSEKSMGKRTQWKSDSYSQSKATQSIQPVNVHLYSNLLRYSNFNVWLCWIQV
jgi:hypothetical protein